MPALPLRRQRNPKTCNPVVSDVGSTDIKILVAGPTTSVRMGNVPGGVPVAPADGKTRAAIGTLLDRLGG